MVIFLFIKNLLNSCHNYTDVPVCLIMQITGELL